MSADARISDIARTAAALIEEALLEKIAAVENAAAEAAEDGDGEDGSPVIAKIAVAIKWPAGADEPEIETKLSYSVRRSVVATAKADRSQTKIQFPDVTKN